MRDRAIRMHPITKIPRGGGSWAMIYRRPENPLRRSTYQSTRPSHGTVTPSRTAVHSAPPQNAAGVEAGGLPTQRGVLRRQTTCLDTGYKAFCRGAKRSH
ncbi:hypothetical protein Aca07nite_35900 [Actinoplanes capillaceus]|uniref:Uncharacterized protein n=1 Tax=Actinoplanes campanulatus TaxID=113559 RepID=A0ABQ3WJA3_9ACTN|nr:hypothetical protein Aca07nite_35900 [Actinoplanes capillaceus]